MSPFAQVCLVAVGTLLLRSTLVTLLAEVSIPPTLQRSLGLVAPAVLAGLVAQGLLLEGTGIRPIGSWHVAAVAAAVVGWKTRSVMASLATGVGALAILEVIA